MTKTSWQDHFKSSITNAEGLYSKESTDVSLLLFCLRAKMIPIKEYLNWAKENYQLPVLAAKFFQVNPPEKELLKKWQKIYNWSVECMPIAEWDGALIIACLEPPANYKHANPTVFVLTSHDVLESTWSAYQKSERSSESDFTNMTALAATVVAVKPKEENFFGADGELILKDTSEHSDEEQSADSLEASEESSSENEEGLELSSEEDSGGMPEGLFADAPVKLNPFDRPSNVNLEATPESDSAVEMPLADATLIPKKGPRSSQPVMNIEVESAEERTKIDTMVPVEDDMEDVPYPGKKNISPAAQIANGMGDLPSAPMKPTTLPGSSAAYLLEKVRKQGQENFDRESQASFQQLKTFFKKSMILAIGDKDRLVKPLIWDNGFDASKAAAPEFNLKTPSIFKIVSGTQKPYHGYVVANDLNEAFFESWNQGQVPDHVTLVPLMDGDLVVGMLMGLGEKSSYNKNVLQFTENVAKNLSQKILKSAMSRAA